MSNRKKDNEPAIQNAAPAVPVELPIIRSYSFVRVSDGQTGGFTTVITDTQGDKVVHQEILDEIYQRNTAEDAFRVLISTKMLHKAPETSYSIAYKDGKYVWKS